MRILEIIKRFIRMFKVKDCTHVCLLCEYYERCKDEEEMNKTNERVDVSEARSEEKGEKDTTSENTT